MRKAKSFFYVSLGILALVGAFHLGAQTAAGQGGVARQLTAPSSGFADIHPTFSPDGGRLAFGRVRLGSGVSSDLMVVDVLSGATSTLVSGSELPENWNPNGGVEWSPDGARIAIHDSNTSSIWVIDLDQAPVQTIGTTWGRVKAERR